MGPGTDRPEPARDADAVSRIRKPSLDEMGSAPNRPIPARAPDVDPRTKAGAYGEKISGPHKPTLDEMGPHAERGLPVAGKPVPRQAAGSRPPKSSTPPKRKPAAAAPAKPAGPGRIDCAAVDRSAGQLASELHSAYVEASDSLGGDMR